MSRLFLIFALIMTLLLVCACADDDDDDNDGGDDDDNDDNDDSDTDDDNDVDDDADDDDDNDDQVDDDVVCNEEYPDSTVGLLSCQPGTYDGYTLFAPTTTLTVYLIDIFGRIINTWPGGNMPGQVVYFLETGQLLRTGNTLNIYFAGGGLGGLVSLQEWDGTVSWSYRYSDSSHVLHHDVEYLPNGNILLLTWEKKNKNEAIAAGLDPSRLNDSEMWSEVVIEVEPVGTEDGNIVWRWDVWDHLVQDYDPSQDNYGVVADHPELLDINYGTYGKGDWLHCNAVDYNEELDQVLIGCRESSEIYVIDHSTTTAEAAGHTGGERGRGGDFLYRWGNPANYDASGDQMYFAQHDGQWIEPGLPGEGNVLVFNNGEHRPGGGTYSTVDEMIPPLEIDGSYTYSAGQPYGPDDFIWTYIGDPPSSFYSFNVSGAQRLENGNTLMCLGASGNFVEVDENGEVLWYYVNPVTAMGVLEQGSFIPTAPTGGQANSCFRAYRYPPDFPGFDGQDMTPGDYLVEP